ncbi:MAG TPA: crotonase/enoyl-CoA hydratase family protein [Solirubrobacterales bacterium]|nr:crotonase/enoyl-CoA hydratase family protein [Solirubrobacterales bacterium]
MAAGEGLRVEHRDGVLILTIDRPAVRNAVDLATARLIAAAIDELEKRDDLAAAVLTGAGGSFCAGMDLKALKEDGTRPVDERRGPFGVCGRPPEKPLIAAVEGAAFGGGFEIVLACDLIVAAVDARFALPEVKRGLIAGGGGVVRLPRQVPRNVALEMIMSGEPIGAERAHGLGLVNRLSAPGEALAVALELATTIAAAAPLAVRTSKRIVALQAGWGDDDLFERQAELVQAVRDSADAAEGTRAFVEKRQPRWSGR